MRARKIIALAGFGTAYVSGVYISYSWFHRPKIDPSQKGKTYADLASKYDDCINRDERWFGITKLRKELISQARGSVLEVAGGTGRNLNYYPTQAQVVVSDSCEEMLEFAKRKSTEGQHLSFAIQDGHNLGYESRSFDTVVDTFGLCSFSDPLQVLNEMQRVCKPDGKILLLEHGKSKTSNWMTNYLNRKAEAHYHNWGCWWNRDIQATVEASGAKIIQSKTSNFGTTYYYVLEPNHKRQQNTE